VQHLHPAVNPKRWNFYVRTGPSHGRAASARKQARIVVNFGCDVDELLAAAGGLLAAEALIAVEDEADSGDYRFADEREPPLPPCIRPPKKLEFPSPPSSI
jgi:hypothetical protein